MHFFKSFSALALIFSVHVHADLLSQRAQALCESNGGEISPVSQDDYHINSQRHACLYFKCGTVVGEGDDTLPIISATETVCIDPEMTDSTDKDGIRDRAWRSCQKIDGATVEIQKLDRLADHEREECIRYRCVLGSESEAGTPWSNVCAHKPANDNELICRYQGAFKPYTTVECSDGKTYELRDENTATEILSENLSEIIDFLTASPDEEEVTSLTCSYAGGGNYSLVINCDDDKEYAAFSGHRSQAGRVEEWNGNSGTMNNEPQSERLSGDDEPSGAITH